MDFSKKLPTCLEQNMANANNANALRAHDWILFVSLTPEWLVFPILRQGSVYKNVNCLVTFEFLQVIESRNKI